MNITREFRYSGVEGVWFDGRRFKCGAWVTRCDDWRDTILGPMNYGYVHIGPTEWHFEEPVKMKQSRIDSVMESLTNLAVGLAVSQVANLIVLPLVLGVQVSQGAALWLGVIYTIISLVRSYTLRRLFNGRSVWAAIKDFLT